MGPTELATSSFGQGFNVTMIQMITGFCSLINGGYYYEPHMVSKITAADGSVAVSYTHLGYKFHKVIDQPTAHDGVKRHQGNIANQTDDTEKDVYKRQA